MKSNRIASIIIESNREVSESFRAYLAANQSSVMSIPTISIRMASMSQYFDDLIRDTLL